MNPCSFALGVISAQMLMLPYFTFGSARRRVGKAAGDVVRETLQAPFAIWTRWASAGGRSRERRYYGLVRVGDRWLTEILVTKGLARRKGVITNLPTGENWRSHSDRLDALESDAKRQRLGGWAGSIREE